MKQATDGVKIIAILAILLIGILLVFGNMSDNLGFTSDSTATAVQQLTLSNNTAVTFTGTVGKTNPVVSSVVIINASTGATITSGNYTLTDTTIIGSGTMTLALNGSLVNASYTTTYDSENQIREDALISNVTDGSTNLSSKFGTVFTLLGVLLIIGAIVWVLKMFGLVGKKKGVFTN